MEFIGLQSAGEGRKILEKYHRVGLRRQVAPLGGAGGEHGVKDCGLGIEDCESGGQTGGGG